MSVSAPSSKNNIPKAISSIRDYEASADWEQLCEQVCLSSVATSARFIFFTAEQVVARIFHQSNWPQFPLWDINHYQAIWQAASFYQGLTHPDAKLNNYLAVPIKRGNISGLLLLYFPSSVPILGPEKRLLLDTFAMHGALLWQASNAKVKSRRAHLSRRVIKRLKNLLNHVATPISAFDAQGRCVFWNQASEQVFGWSHEEITQHGAPIRLFYPDTNEQQQLLASLQELRNSAFKEWRPFNKAGARLCILCTSIKLTEGIVLCFGHDITEQKEWLNQQRLAANVFESSYDGIIVSDPSHRITHVNPAFTRITGFSAAEVIDRYPYAFKYLLSNHEFYRQLGDQLKVQDHWQGELISQRKNGEDCALLLAITAVKDEVGQVLNHVAVLSDITHLKQHEANLKHQAFHDALTDIPNRLLFSELLERAISRCERHHRQLAVCYVDLDGFKAVNDSFGHAAGDALLIEVSRRLTASTRGGDAVARLGGDEFVLLFTEFSSVAECAEILGRIQQLIRKPVHLDQGVLNISASIGVALYPADADQAELLLRYADQAMYQAKKQGKDAYVFFNSLNNACD